MALCRGDQDDYKGKGHSKRTTTISAGGGGWGWRGFGGYGDRFGDSTTTEQDYKEGTLVVDKFDAKSKQLIWRSSAEGTLSDSAAKNEKNLDRGVARMLKEFPPESGKRQ